MEIYKEYMLAKSFWTSGSYLVTPAKAIVYFLSKLSELYSTLCKIKGQGKNEALEVEFEASWNEWIKRVR